MSLEYCKRGFNDISTMIHYQELEIWFNNSFDHYIMNQKVILWWSELDRSVVDFNMWTYENTCCISLGILDKSPV